MFDIVLVHPQIPPNTGNVMRMCANTGSRLHLVAPLGFDVDDARLRRAGMDYRDMTTMTVHENWAAVRHDLGGRRMFAFTSSAARWHTATVFAAGDVLVLGRESDGLPADVLAEFGEDRRCRIPMVAGSRSLNLSNSAALAVYEAWRQVGFPGAV